MISLILYIIHVAGMAGVILISADIIFNGLISKKNKRKAAVFFASFAHAQILSGLLLYVAKFNEVNHMKIGIKMLLGIVVAVLATIYSAKVKENKNPSASLAVYALVLAIIITGIAFLWH